MIRSLSASQIKAGVAAMVAVVLIAAGYSIFSFNKTLLQIPIGLVVVISMFFTLTRKLESAPGNNNDLLKACARRAESSFREMSRNASFCAGEVESAICSFNKLCAMDGADTVFEPLNLSGNSQDVIERMMLKRAEVVFPAAYKKLDRRGKPDQSTLTARQFFISVVREVIKMQADGQMAAQHENLPGRSLVCIH
jgi:hypothetical protein